jgi:aryl-alcohol dehydrogenase-like predicted oxidoreductase
VLVRNPRDQGYLTDRGSDIMADSYEKSASEVRQRIERAQCFRFLVRDGRTLSQAAIQFLLQLPGVTAVLPRLFRRKELVETVAVSRAPALTADELLRISLT